MKVENYSEFDSSQIEIGEKIAWHHNLQGSWCALSFTFA